MLEILKVYSKEIRKKILINIQKCFPPSYSSLKLVEKITKCIVALGDFFTEHLNFAS